MDKNKQPVNYDHMAHETVGRWSMEPAGNIEDENGMTNPKLYKAVATGLLDTVKNQVGSLHGEAPKRSLLCPKGCEKVSRHWMWMFIGSAIVTAILSALLFTVVCLLDRMDQRQSMLQEAQDMLKK
uniref:Col_cuticle_N domain-containing protein n=1 Tax=Steinernema glaseri TaxID=37863 RepID=A0A1I7XXP7_9BILA